MCYELKLIALLYFAEDYMYISPGKRQIYWEQKVHLM